MMKTHLYSSVQTPGGAATLVPATGYTVHGVLMKVDTVEGWKKLKDFDSGYSPQVVDAFPYQPGEFDISEENEEFYEKKPIPCFAFVMLDEYDDNIFEHDYLHQMEKKPQERYLRLIADGMLKAGVDPNYVEDEILAVPFLPTRSEKDWISFPKARPPPPQKKKGIFVRNKTSKKANDESLPSITFEKYKELCDAQATTDQHVYFVLHNYVLRLIPIDNPAANDGSKNNHPPPDTHTEGTMSATSAWNSNPSVQWMRQNAHGKGDLTHISHVIVTDPAVPWAPTPADLQPIHYRWAENQMYDFLVQSNVTAEKVYELVTDNDEVKDATGEQSHSKTRWSWGIFNCHANSADNRQLREQEKTEAATKTVSVESSETNSSKKQDQNDELQLDNVEGKVTRLTAEKASALHFQKGKEASPA